MPYKRIRVLRRFRSRAPLRTAISRLAAIYAEGLSLKAAGLSDEVIDGADIIPAAMVSPIPVFDGSKVMPGSHINGIGSYLPGLRQLDSEPSRRARFYRQHGGRIRRGEDFIIPCKEGIFSFNRIREFDS